MSTFGLSVMGLCGLLAYGLAQGLVHGLLPHPRARGRLRRRLLHLGFEAATGGHRLQRGPHVVLAPWGPSIVLEAPLVALGRSLSTEAASKRGSAVGDGAFDRVFRVAPASPWAFHGLSEELRGILLQLARLGSVRGGARGVRVFLLDDDPLAVARATDLLVALGQAAARRDLERIVRSDPSDRVATEALRALHDADPERGRALALAVGRQADIWRRERARIRKEVAALAARLDRHPDATRLLDQLQASGVCRVLAFCNRPLPVLVALQRSDRWVGPPPSALSRKAWRVLRAMEPGVRTGELHAEAWKMAQPSLTRRDVRDVGRMAHVLPAGAVPSVIDTLVELGPRAAPVLRSLSSSLPDARQRALALQGFTVLAARHSRGALSVTSRSGGAVSLAEEAQRTPVAPGRQATTASGSSSS